MILIENLLACIGMMNGGPTSILSSPPKVPYPSSSTSPSNDNPLNKALRERERRRNTSFPAHSTSPPNRRSHSHKVPSSLQTQRRAGLGIFPSSDVSSDEESHKRIEGTSAVISGVTAQGRQRSPVNPTAGFVTLTMPHNPMSVDPLPSPEQHRQRRRSSSPASSSSSSSAVTPTRTRDDRPPASNAAGIGRKVAASLQLFKETSSGATDAELASVSIEHHTVASHRASTIKGKAPSIISPPIRSSNGVEEVREAQFVSRADWPDRKPSQRTKSFALERANLRELKADIQAKDNAQRRESTTEGPAISFDDLFEDDPRGRSRQRSGDNLPSVFESSGSVSRSPDASPVRRGPRRESPSRGIPIPSPTAVSAPHDDSGNEASCLSTTPTSRADQRAHAQQTPVTPRPNRRPSMSPVIRRVDINQTPTTTSRSSRPRPSVSRTTSANKVPTTAATSVILDLPIPKPSAKAQAAVEHPQDATPIGPTQPTSDPVVTSPIPTPSVRPSPYASFSDSSEWETTSMTSSFSDVSTLSRSHPEGGSNTLADNPEYGDVSDDEEKNGNPGVDLHDGFDQMNLDGVLPAVPLRPFRNQVGGHSAIYKFTKRAVCKVLHICLMQVFQAKPISFVAIGQSRELVLRSGGKRCASAFGFHSTLLRGHAC